MTTGDRSTLPVTFLSIIVKKSAVALRFDGGLEDFAHRFPPIGENEELLQFVRMSLGDVDRLLNELFSHGLLPGQDLAVATMETGPILSCPGLNFESQGKFMAAWTVKAGVGSDNAPSSWDPETQTAFTPNNSFGYYWSAPPVLKAPAEKAARAAPRRVVFGSGAVHYLYADGDDDD